MKKIFTLIAALVGFASISSAATVDDIAPLKHSYVLVCDDWNSNGTEKIASGSLYGNGFFFTPTGHDCSVKKGSVNLSVVNENDDYHVTEAIAAKYGQEYNVDHFNSLRLKNNQDIMVMKVTAHSKIIFFLQGNNKTGTEARIPKLWKGGEGGVQSKADCTDANALNPKPDADHPTTDAGFRFEYTVDDDMTLWVGSWNGDMFLSYVIVEANEAEGTPSVKVGQQTYEDGLWFKEVTVTPREAYGITTDVYYTTDGSEPTAESQKYTAPIKCYKEMTLKFQAFVMGTPVPDANNEASVNFSFDAPAIEAEGANITITSPYEGAKNFYSLNGAEAQEGSTITLTESATVTAFSQIVNGSYATFTTKTTTKDVYVLNPIKEKKIIAVTAGEAVLDEEATAASTTGEVYKVEGGEISADKTDFFVKNLTFKAEKNADYQVPAGQEVYIQMSNTNITFFVAEGDSVNVKVVCTKNSCKNIDADDAEDGSQVNDRKCYVNVSGTNYCLKDEEGNETNDLKLYPNANEFTFGLKGADGGSFFTFQKYSGTGNIMISSIEITPAGAEPVFADFEDGKYYLVNVATTMAWGCGNAWGTQASLVKHPEYLVLHKQENGTYIMETQASNGGDSYYFGGDQGEYMDGKPEAAVALSFILGEELGTDMNDNPVYAYYITSDSTNFYGWDGENTKLANKLAAGDENAMWLVIPHERAIEALAEATEDDPMDATFLLLDPNFSRNNRNQGAWTGDTFGVGGDNTNTNAEKWGGNSQTFDISQTVDVPNGKYKISWNGFYRYNNTGDNTNDIAIAAHADGTEVINSFVYVNGKDYALTSIADETAAAALSALPFSQTEASAAFAQGLYAQSAEVIVTDGKLTIGIKKTEHLGTDWTVWDNFELEYYGPAAEPADPNELVINGDCEGADGTSLVVKHGDGGGAFTANFVDGAGIDGSRAAVIHAIANAANEWDTQFFIVANNHTFALGEKYVVKFWVKADKAATISVQGHKAPGDYLTWYVDGASDVNVTTEWQEVVWQGTVNDSMAQYGGNMEGMQTLAFNLNNDKTLENNYYFDNISWKLVTEDGIETVQVVKIQNGAVYNLAGQKVDANYKGVVIKNGKKMLQK